MTSRRFCDVCAVENQGHEWLPRAVVLAGILAGLFGFGSLLRAPEYEKPTVPQAARLVGPASETVAGSKSEVAPTRSEGSSVPAIGVAPAGEPVRAESSKEQLQPERLASDEPVHFCGAMTKKGKPCSRRVRTKGRCWQHAGQPAALASQPAPDVY